MAAVGQFRSPAKAVGDLDAKTTASLLLAAADVVLVIDSRGVIRDLAFANEELAAEGGERWLGQRWVDTVTAESRPKVEALLEDASTKRLQAVARRRQVNHPSAGGAEIPVMYSAVHCASTGRTVAVGRDLRAVAALQQRLVNAQQALERDYARLRQSETRYRLLFQMSSEAVLIVEARSRKVVEANPAAHALLAASANRVVGRTFPEGFDAAGKRAIEALLVSAETSGRSGGARAHLAADGREIDVAVSVFRQDGALHFLVRLAPAGASASAGSPPGARARVLEVLEALPDGFVVTDAEGRVLQANRAFLDMVQLATEEQARGQTLARWLGRPGVDLNVMLTNLRQSGSVRLFATDLRGEYGSTMEVEISAVSAAHADPPALGFVIRDVGRRFAATGRRPRGLPRSVDQLTDLIGRVPLKELVRETTDYIERLCIEAALQLTQDNRATAAEMLGLSRQSLYVKLRRYGIADTTGESSDARAR